MYIEKLDLNDIPCVFSLSSPGVWKLLAITRVYGILFYILLSILARYTFVDTSIGNFHLYFFHHVHVYSDILLSRLFYYEDNLVLHRLIQELL